MKKIKFITFGCSNNFAESEMMKGILKEKGYEIVDHDPDITVVNMCHVKGPSIAKAKKAIKQNHKVILSGCVTELFAKEIKKEMPNLKIITTHNIDKIDLAVKELENGPDFLEHKRLVKLNYPRVKDNPLVHIVPISNGCPYNCTYCATKLIKGDLYSFPKDQILKDVQAGLDSGAKEIWVTSQDTGAYGLDSNSNLPDLLKGILELEGDFMVRLGMSNPNHIYNHLKELIKVFKHPKMFKFLHIPVQSGSDKVLKDMRRPHTTKEYYRTVESFRQEIQDFTISTDLIIGYPTEDESDFQKTLDLLRISRPNVLNLSRFWPIKGTFAATLKQLPSQVVKQRVLETKKTFDAIALENNRRWLGRTEYALVDEFGKNNTFIARNKNYRPIVVQGNHQLGEWVKVKIKEVTSFDLRT